MKTAFLITALSVSSAMAQFGWDDGPGALSAQSALDEFDVVLRAPVIEPIEPVAAIFQPLLLMLL